VVQACCICKAALLVIVLLQTISISAGFTHKVEDQDASRLQNLALKQGVKFIAYFIDA
jgi:hypothetical protein